MAVLLSPVGGVAGQFFDNNGNPLTGGKMYSYVAGTTTPQATYTSSAGVVAHSNPIILDAGGRVPGGEIWLTDGLQYKFVLKNANDVLIGTYDNIIGINSNFVNFLTETEVQTATAGQTVFTLTTMQYQPGTNNLTVYVDGVNQIDGSTYSYVETSSTVITFTAGLHVGALVKFTTAQTLSTGVTDASLVTYDPPFTGSVGTTVEDKLAQYVSVFDFMTSAEIADVTTRAGAVDVTAKIQAAIDYVESQKGGVVWFPSGVYLITDTIDAKTGVKLQGVYGERQIPSQTVETGTKLKWGGSTNSTILSVFDVRHFTLNGMTLDANGISGMTGILLSTASVNQIAASGNTFEFFNIDFCAVAVQWGTLGLATPNNQTDGEIFRQFTIWAKDVVGSVGFVLNSGNAAQYSVIENGGIVVDEIAIDIVVANQLQVRRVTSGYKTATAFCRVSTGINILIEGCESENQADLYGGSNKISYNSKFLLVVAPQNSYPVYDTTIVLNQNTINNPIEVQYPVRIVSTGDAWGYCYQGATIVPSDGTFTSGVSSCLALNNGTPTTLHGWQASEFSNVNNIQPEYATFQHDKLTQPNQYAHLITPVTAQAGVNVTTGVDSRGYGGNLWERICCGTSSAIGAVGDLIYRIGGASPKKILTLRSSEVVIGEPSTSTRLRIAQAETLANNATGTVGQIVWDTSYIYVCVGTNSWKRATLNSY